jgi:predicted nucleic acid-binding protein
VSTERPVFIIDASVAGKWFLPDEEHVELAGRIGAAFVAREIDLLAPEHFSYEVPSLIRKAFRRERFEDLSKARTLVDAFLALNIRTVSGPGLIRAGFDESAQFGCSLYDGTYVALSRRTGYPLLHADQRLGNSLGRRFPLEMWIEDYGSKDVSAYS